MTMNALRQEQSTYIFCAPPLCQGEFHFRLAYEFYEEAMNSASNVLRACRRKASRLTMVRDFHIKLSRERSGTFAEEGLRLDDGLKDEVGEG